MRRLLHDPLLPLHHIIAMREFFWSHLLAELPLNVHPDALQAVSVDEDRRNGER
jgi:hypothetical protein